MAARGPIVIQFRGDTSDLDRQLEASAQRANQAFNKTGIGDSLNKEKAKAKDAFTGIADQAKKAGSDIAQVFAFLPGKLGALYAPVMLLQTAFRGLGNVTKETGTSLVSAAGAGRLVATAFGAGAVAAAALAIAFGGAAFSGAKLADDLKDLADTLGVSSGFLERLQVGYTLMGKNIEGARQSVGRFEMLLGQAATGEVPKLDRALKALGVNAATMGTDVEKSLTIVLNTLAESQDRSQAAALAMQFFGRQGITLLQIWRDLKDESSETNRIMKEWGLTIGTENTAAAAGLADKVDSLTLKLGAMQKLIAVKLGPTFEDLIDKFARWLNDNSDDIEKMAKDLAEVANQVFEIIKLLDKAARKIEEAKRWFAPDQSNMRPVTVGGMKIGEVERGSNIDWIFKKLGSVEAGRTEWGSLFNLDQPNAAIVRDPARWAGLFGLDRSSGGSAAGSAEGTRRTRLANELLRGAGAGAGAGAGGGAGQLPPAVQQALNEVDAKFDVLDKTLDQLAELQKRNNQEIAKERAREALLEAFSLNTKRKNAAIEEAITKQRLKILDLDTRNTELWKARIQKMSEGDERTVNLVLGAKPPLEGPIGVREASAEEARAALDAFTIDERRRIAAKKALDEYRDSLQANIETSEKLKLQIAQVFNPDPILAENEVLASHLQYLKEKQTLEIQIAAVTGGDARNDEIRFLQEQLDLNTQIAEARRAIARALTQDPLTEQARQATETARAVTTIAEARRFLDQSLTFKPLEAEARALETIMRRMKSATELVGDAAANTLESLFELVDRGFAKMTQGLGGFGRVIAGILSDITRLVLSNAFIKLFGGAAVNNLGGGGGNALGGLSGLIPGSGGTQTSGGGIGGLLGRFLGFGGGSQNAQGVQIGTQVAGMGAAAGALVAGPSLAGGLLPVDILNKQNLIGSIPLFGHLAQGIGGGAAKGATSLIGKTLGSLAGTFPILGIGLGASLGGKSILGNIAGGIGGGILGANAAFLAGSGLGLGTTAISLLSNPFTIIAGIGLLIGGWLLGRAKQRRADESLADSYWVEEMNQVRSLIAQVNADRIDGQEALAVAAQLRAQTIAALNTIKTKSVRESRLKNQLRDLDNTVVADLKKAVERQAQRQRIQGQLVPEFATGGRVPGIDRGFDSTLVLVRPDEVILNKQQQALLGGRRTFQQIGVPGFESGGKVAPLLTPPNAGRQQPLVITFEGVTIDSESIFIRGARTNTGQRVLVDLQRTAKRNRSDRRAA